MPQLMSMEIQWHLITHFVCETGVFFQLFVDRRLTHFSTGPNVAGIKYISRGIWGVTMEFF